jgi:threonyl-tRNA synthetase
MPIRYAEFLPVILRENTGLLGGLLDSRSVSADEAHIFCAPEHLEAEFISSLQFIDKIIKMFGFEYYWYFKGRGHKYAGTENRWEKATNSLHSAFQKAGFTYASDPQEVSFAGPIAEARLIDNFGREWKGPTVSLDLNAPERFGLRYLGSDGKTHVPLMIVRSVFGSMERFIALLLEHTSGILPLWLAPEQIRVLPVSKENDAYAKEVSKAVREAGYRVNVDYGQESIAKKITKAECEKIPYIIIVGDKEEKNHLITLRNSYQTQEQMIPVEAFLSIIHEEVALKKLRVCKNTK